MPDHNFFSYNGPYSIKTLASEAGCDVQNTDNSELMIRDVHSIEHASDGDITFLSNPKYISFLEDCQASACILHPKYADQAPSNLAILVSNNPYAAYAKIANLFYPIKQPQQIIDDKAIINPGATIGKNVTIEAGAYIGENSSIGDHSYIAAGAYVGKSVQIGTHCSIYPNVTILNAIVGSHVLIHAGCSIGQDGFGFATDQGVHIKVPQLGRVIIEDSVEIGANCCIDRGAGPDTIIGSGTKIDNLVQIGHNAHIGKGCIIVSQAGVSGSTKLGDYVVIGGQSGIAGHLTIGSMANVAAKSGVIRDVNPKQVVGGIPAVPIKQWHRQTVVLKQLTKKAK